MSDDSIFGHNISVDLVTLKHHSCVLQHFASKSFGQLLAGRVNLRFEGVLLANIGFSQILRIESISIQESEILLQATTLYVIQEQVGYLIFSFYRTIRIKVNWIHMVDAHQCHQENADIPNIWAGLSQIFECLVSQHKLLGFGLDGYSRQKTSSLQQFNESVICERNYLLGQAHIF